MRPVLRSAPLPDHSGSESHRTFSKNDQSFCENDRSFRRIGLIFNQFRHTTRLARYRCPPLAARGIFPEFGIPT